jgi:uncharacterized RDD family membrane protein YckC
MTESILSLIKEWGIWGVFISLFSTVMNTITDYQLLLFILFALITLFYMGIKFLGYRQQKKLMKQM